MVPAFGQCVPPGHIPQRLRTGMARISAWANDSLREYKVIAAGVIGEAVQTPFEERVGVLLAPRRLTLRVVPCHARAASSSVPCLRVRFS